MHINLVGYKQDFLLYNHNSSYSYVCICVVFSFFLVPVAIRIFHSYSFLLSFIFQGLLRLQQIYQGLKPGNESFQVEMVKRIANVTMAIDFLHTLEDLGRFTNKYIVLDCPTEMAKEILIQHVRDISLGRRTYHYLLSGLVSTLTINSHMPSNKRHTWTHSPIHPHIHTLQTEIQSQPH